MSQLRTTTTKPATTELLCQYGGVLCPPAEIFDIDGRWCTYEHQSFDRMSEITVWRQAAGAR